MKTLSLAITMFVFFLIAGFGISMMTPEEAVAGTSGCKCLPQIHCQSNQGECSGGNVPYYSCKQSDLLFGCFGPYDCGCTFVFCGSQCTPGP